MKIIKLSRAITLLVFSFLLLNLSVNAKPVYKQARIFIDSETAFNLFMQTHPDIIHRHNNYVDIITFQDKLEVLEALGFKTEVIHEDVVAFNQSRLDPTRDMGGYRTLDEIYSYIDGIIASYPEIVSTKVDIGQTIEGRTMWAIKISDNPNVDEDEPEILHTAATHAREVITPELLINYIDHLTANYGTDAEITDLINSREIWFVLLVNPDGYYRNQVIAPAGGGMWRKNRRNNGTSFGVDLNRNFSYQWGFDDVGSSPDGSDETFRGGGPFSEPEIQNMKDFALAHDFTICVYWHSASNLIVWPWDYNMTESPDEYIYRALADSIAVLNGYNPQYIEPLYRMNGSACDWHYGEQSTKDKSYSFLIEVGDSDIDGFWPALARVPQLVGENLPVCIFLTEMASNVKQIFLPNPPALSVPGEVETTGYQVHWTHDDPDNPAVNYELVEYLIGIGITDPAENLLGYVTDNFTVSGSQYFSVPSSFYSGAENNTIRYFHNIEPIEITFGEILEFQTYYDIQERYDYAYVEVSTDGIGFAPIEGNITTNYNPNGLNRGHGITGNSSGWVSASFDLSAFAGQSIYIRFSYYTDGSITREGIYFDDISPANTVIANNIISSSIPGLYYDIVSQPEGVYYYKVRAQDAEDQWSDFSSLERTVASSPYLCGDTDGNGSIDILDIVRLINFLYKDDLPPDPFDSGDIDGVPDINILDIIYLINFKYKAGPAPDCS